jgi:hypothetical protein
MRPSTLTGSLALLCTVLYFFWVPWDTCTPLALYVLTVCWWLLERYLDGQHKPPPESA